MAAHSPADSFVEHLAEEVAERVAMILAERQPEPNRLLTDTQAGQQLGISDRSIRGLIEKGLLVGIKVGPGEGASRIEQRELDRYVEQQRLLASRSVAREDREHDPT